MSIGFQDRQAHSAVQLRYGGMPVRVTEAVNRRALEDYVKIDRRCLVSGVMAGFLAGAVLIVFYFAFDLVRSEPLATPRFLAGSMLGQGALEITSVHIALFTVVHFVAFIVLGVLASAVTEAIASPRTLLVGAVYGLFAHSLLFYLALVVSGASIVNAPAWPIVFFGNVVAGAVIMAYLRWASTEEGLTGFAAGVLGNPVVRDGLTAGMLGAAVVALWFLIVDMIVGRPLYTPAALGSAMLYGAAAADAVLVSPGTVLGYTLYHIAAFGLLGVTASALITQAERFPPLMFGLILLFVVVETFVVLLVALLGAWIMQEVAWWAILVGNVLAATSMGAYLHQQHPALKETLREEVLWAEP